MQMVILAGGLALRMRPLSRLVPNPLIRVDNRPFLAYQLDLLRANGIRRVVLCVGHLGHKVRAYFRDGANFGIEIRYSDDGSHLLGTAGALRRAAHLLDDVFFVQYGDAYVVLQYPRAWSYFHRFAKLGLLVLNHAARGDPAATCAARRGLVTSYRPGTPSSDLEFADTGISILRKEALALVPPRRRMDLPTLFDTLAVRGELLSFRTEMPLHSVASRDGLSEFRRYIAAMSA